MQQTTNEGFPYARTFWRLLAAVACIRLVYLWIFPFDLVGDEAYYWDWGRQLDWGYFSKPPGIAWLMALAGTIGGHTAEGLRLFAVLLGTAGLAFLFLLGRSLFNDRIAFWASLATLATPGNTGLNLLLTIDAPLVFCWIGALYAFWRVCEIHTADTRQHGEQAPHQSARNSPIWWSAVLICFLGFGALSKQMMLVFYPLAFLFLLTDNGLRALLRKPWLWFGALAGLLFLLPPLLWNAANNWITFQHTQHHFEGDSLRLGTVLKNSGEYIGTQLGILTPVTWSLTMLLAFVGVRRVRNWPREARFLWIFSAPALLVVLLMSLRQGINPNWPAVFYAAGFLLTAAWFGEEFSIGRLDRWRRFFKPGVYAGAGLVVVAVLLPLIVLMTGLRGSDLDPFRRLNGWSALAQKVEEVRQNLEAPADFILTAGHRYTTSQLAFYLPDQPRVYRWPNQPGRIESQYELWGLPGNEALAANALIIAHEDVMRREDGKLPSQLVARFKSIRHLQTLAIPLGSGRERQYHLFFGHSWIPQSRSQELPE